MPINGSPDPSTSGVDLDAYRRNRSESDETWLTHALSRVRASDEPAVTFAHLVEFCVPRLADGCEVELANGASPCLRIRATGSATIVESGSSPSSSILRATFRGSARGHYPSYAGVLSCWWTERAATDNDRALVQVVAMHGVSLVDREQLTTILGRADDQSSSLALDAIMNRSINIAIGIIMCDESCGESDAEDVLRRQARDAGRTTHDHAREMVQQRTEQATQQSDGTAPSQRGREPRFLRGVD